jgi:peroxiredoxin
MHAIRTFILVIALLGNLSDAAAQPKIGEKVPEILLRGSDGRLISLYSLTGKVVLIDFWASWCGPCRVANKRMVSLYEKYKKEGFEIFGVSIDDNADAWKKAMHADNIQWLQVNQPGGWDAPVARQWNIDQIPTSYLIDKEGRIAAIDPDQNKLSSLIGKLLKQPYQPPPKP